MRRMHARLRRLLYVGLAAVLFFAILGTFRTYVSLAVQVGSWLHPGPLFWLTLMFFGLTALINDLSEILPWPRRLADALCMLTLTVGTSLSVLAGEYAFTVTGLVFLAMFAVKLTKPEVWERLRG